MYLAAEIIMTVLYGAMLGAEVAPQVRDNEPLGTGGVASVLTNRT